jgi:hypothetical protein
MPRNSDRRSLARPSRNVAIPTCHPLRTPPRPLSREPSSRRYRAGRLGPLPRGSMVVEGVTMAVRYAAAGPLRGRPLGHAERRISALRRPQHRRPSPYAEPPRRRTAAVVMARSGRAEPVRHDRRRRRDYGRVISRMRAWRGHSAGAQPRGHGATWVRSVAGVPTGGGTSVPGRGSRTSRRRAAYGLGRSSGARTGVWLRWRSRRLSTTQEHLLIVCSPTRAECAGGYGTAAGWRRSSPYGSSLVGAVVRSRCGGFVGGGDGGAGDGACRISGGR